MWSITKKPSGSNATVSPTTGGQTLVKPLDKLGEYIVKADCNGNYDTIKIVVYRIEFERVEGHASVEGKFVSGGGYKHKPAPQEYWEIIRQLNGGTRAASYVGNSISLYAQGKTYAANYKAAYEPPALYFQVSTENKYNAFLNVGDASISVKVTIDWTASGSLAPVGTGVLSNGSVNAWVKVPGSNQAISSWNLGISPPPPTLQDPVIVDPVPVVYTHTVSGKYELGWVQVSMGYADSGANLGLGTVTLAAVYSVEKGP